MGAGLLEVEGSTECLPPPLAGLAAGQTGGQAATGGCWAESSQEVATREPLPCPSLVVWQEVQGRVAGRCVVVVVVEPGTSPGACE